MSVLPSKEIPFETKVMIGFAAGSLIIVALFIGVWANAYNTCTDARCPGSRATLTKNMFDLPVCTCVAL